MPLLLLNFPNNTEGNLEKITEKNEILMEQSNKVGHIELLRES